MRDDFVFADEEESYETSDSYGPGGFFPVRLGDILRPDLGPPRRYRVAAKLGWGGYATVWLARDLVNEKTVALNVVAASESQKGDDSETVILERLRPPPSTEPLVLQLLDSFTVSSPNGVHQVLVTEPVMVLRSYLQLKLPGQERMTRLLIRRLLQGVAFINARGIAHEDLHPNNIGAALPELEAFSEIMI
ncbi:kinase-like domain-containing protein [Mycena leptocephala]|nr:kinase-like domain-containing protein [Mycena leptocephala]